jgi:hypothetical protein
LKAPNKISMNGCGSSGCSEYVSNRALKNRSSFWIKLRMCFKQLTNPAVTSEMAESVSDWLPNSRLTFVRYAGREDGVDDDACAHTRSNGVYLATSLTYSDSLMSRYLTQSGRYLHRGVEGLEPCGLRFRGTRSEMRKLRLQVLQNGNTASESAAVKSTEPSVDVCGHSTLKYCLISGV